MEKGLKESMQLLETVSIRNTEVTDVGHFLNNDRGVRTQISTIVIPSVGTLFSMFWLIYCPLWIKHPRSLVDFDSLYIFIENPFCGKCTEQTQICTRIVLCVSLVSASTRNGYMRCTSVIIALQDDLYDRSLVVSTHHVVPSYLVAWLAGDTNGVEQK